jgi:predicted outer membrane repeat protein
MSSYISAFRGSSSYAVSDPREGCASEERISQNVSGDEVADTSAIAALETAVNTALASSVECVTVTFTSTEPSEAARTLNFYSTNEDDVVVREQLELTSTVDRKVFLETTQDVIFDFTGRVLDSPITTNSKVDLYVDGIEFVGSQGGSSIGGGVIYAEGNVTVTGSVFRNNRSRNLKPGGAVYGKKNVEVTNSSFLSNSSEGSGGAIYSVLGVEVENSTFSLNEGFAGGAIWSHYSYSIGSTFDGNTAQEGGALFAEDGVLAWNSTFFDNSAYIGGGIHVYDPADPTGAEAILNFNTFLDNSADVGGGSSIDVSNLFSAGNIFADSVDNRAQLNVTNDIASLFNLSTGSEARDGIRLVDFTSLKLSPTLASNGGPTQTLALLSGSSVAVDYVPFEEFGDLSLYAYDQRGFDREGNLDAGAFEFGIADSSETVTRVETPQFSAESAPFIALDAKPTNISAGKTVQVTGVNLTRVTEVYVNGIRVKVTSKTGTSLSFKAPAGITGAANIRLVGAGYETTLYGALNFVATEASGAKAKTVIPGFAANSTNLTRPMKRAIRTFINANPELTRVTCNGFTSAPATAQDLVLARQRGKVTCDFIKKIKPELEVKVLKGDHTNIPGQQIRRVRLVME